MRKTQGKARARKSEPLYVALIGDVVSSREIEPRRRARAQAVLEERIESLNRELGQERLAARITLTGGDEVQALFRHGAALVKVVRELTEALFDVQGPPLRMRFGIGRGPLATGPLPLPWAPNPALLDGQAFHRARGALARARDLERWVCFEQMENAGPDGFRAHTDEALEALFALMGAIRADWTVRQGRVSIRFREGSSQAGLAQKLRVSPSVISETLKAARHNLLVQGEAAAAGLLEALDVRS